MTAVVNRSVRMLNDECPGLFEDLPHWFQSLSDEDLSQVWLSSITAMVTEYSPEIDARSFVTSLLEVKQRLMR
jgi:hypothetical protein